MDCGKRGGVEGGVGRRRRGGGAGSGEREKNLGGGKRLKGARRKIKKMEIKKKNKCG